MAREKQKILCGKGRVDAVKTYECLVAVLFTSAQSTFTCSLVAVSLYVPLYIPVCFRNRGTCNFFTSQKRETITKQSFKNKIKDKEKMGLMFLSNQAGWSSLHHPLAQLMRMIIKYHRCYNSKICLFITIGVIGHGFLPILASVEVLEVHSSQRSICAWENSI